MLAPAGTRQAVVERLSMAAEAAEAEPAAQKGLAELGMVCHESTHAQMGDNIRHELVLYRASRNARSFSSTERGPDASRARSRDAGVTPC